MLTQTRTHTPPRRTPLSGVSLLVLVAFALGASVARSEAALDRMESRQDRAVLVTTVPQTRAARLQRKQQERPAAAAAAVERIASARREETRPAFPVRPVNLPCLRESLLALPPPVRGA